MNAALIQCPSVKLHWAVVAGGGAGELALQAEALGVCSVERTRD